MQKYKMQFIKADQPVWAGGPFLN